MSTIARLNAALTWDLDDFDRGSAHIENAFAKLRDTVAGLATAFENAGRRMTLGITAPLLGLSAVILKTGSDAADLQSALSYTFGEMTADVNAWAEQSGDAMGRSTQTMQKSALAFGQLFKAALPTKEAAEYSKLFAQLTVDSESFFNVPFDVALGKLRSGLTGEAEPLRDFGVFLSEAAVEAKGLEMGLIKQGEELSENGKIMARAALIAEGLSAAQGDAERTAGDLSNRFRQMKAELAELAVEMYERLKPAAEWLVSWATRAIQWFKALPGWVKDAAVKFAIFAALAGPVIVILTKLATLVLPLVLIGMMGMSTGLGRALLALSAFINPLGTLIVMAGKFILAGGGLGTILRVLAGLFGAVSWPIAAAVAAVLLFKDQIVAGLQAVFDTARTTLGPRLEELFVNLGDVVDRLREVFIALTDKAIVDRLGQWVNLLIQLGGTVVIRALGAVIDLINILLETVLGLATVIEAVMQGQWRAAWSAAADTVNNNVGRMLRAIGTLFPALAAAIKLMEMAGLITPAPTPDKADGLKKHKLLGWLLDPDKDSPGLPVIPAGTFSESGSGSKKKAGGRARSGPSADELAERREEIKLDQELAVAREKNDIEAIRRLERQRELKSLIKDYERAGLTTALAREAAERDMVEIDQARAVADAKAILDADRKLDIQMAELQGDEAQVRFLKDQEWLEERIDFYRQRGKDLAEAEILAQTDLLQLESARADAAARRLRDQQTGHEIELARLRGDSDASIRALEEADRRRRDAERYQQDGMSEEDAQARALAEGLEREKARLTGTFRETFRDGLRAAMDGNLGKFFENWMKERTFNALANVLDRLATSLADMIFNSAQGSGGGGGFFGSLLSGLGGLFGLTSTGWHGGQNSPGTMSLSNNNSLHGFATGGSFQIRGFSGIDNNLLSLNGNPVARVSQGEIVNVQKGAVANDNRTASAQVRLVVEANEYFDARVEQVSGNVVAQAAPELVRQGGRAGVAAMQLRDRKKL